MEEVTPPLFLRFLNLLMNDAIFLLDEALANMAQLRTMQTARYEFTNSELCRFDATFMLILLVHARNKINVKLKALICI